MILSHTAEYALQAVLHLAATSGDGPVRVSEVAGALRIPQNYLSKILHGLVRAGILVSTRGRHGGFRLASRPEELPLSRVIAPFDRFDRRHRCLLGNPTCGDATACAAHAHWKAVAAEVEDFFLRTTVADLRTAPRVLVP